MLKLQHFFILFSFLLATTLVACEDDKDDIEPSGGSQVSGGQVSGGDMGGQSGGEALEEDLGGQNEEDMGLEGGQSSDQETQLTGGTAQSPAMGGTTSDSEGGQQSEEDCDDSVSPEDSESAEIDLSCLPEEDDSAEDMTEEDSSDDSSDSDEVEVEVTDSTEEDSSEG